MATFDDDFVKLNFADRPRIFNCRILGLGWPPPEVISVQGFDFKRISYSQISDDDRAQLSHVCRGAEYTVYAGTTTSLPYNIH